MMAPCSDVPPADDSKPIVVMHSNASTHIGASAPPSNSKRKITHFPYRLRSISLDGGHTLLRLFEDLMIEVDHDNRKCRVLHWEVELPLTDVADIGRTVGRQFLKLYSKAVDERLTEPEEMRWAEILTLVDYQGFCTDRSPPRYVEGVLKTSSPAAVVEWHDGETEILDAKVFRQLNVLNEGDKFGAWVKWGRNHRAVEVTGLKILTDE